MKFASLFAAAASLAIAALSSSCLADNPVVQTKFTADPAPIVVGDTVYLITSHDEDDARVRGLSLARGSAPSDHRQRAIPVRGIIRKIQLARTCSGIAKPEVVAVLNRLRRGEPAESVLDDRFVAAFAVAGTTEDCLVQAAAYRSAASACVVSALRSPSRARRILRPESPTVVSMSPFSAICAGCGTQANREGHVGVSSERPALDAPGTRSP